MSGRRKEVSAMSWYFMVDTYIDEERGRGEYDEYIRQVMPIVEAHGEIGRASCRERV